MGSTHNVLAILAVKPAQRTQEDVQRLVDFLSELPFFAGVSSASLELLSTCLGIQHAAPDEVLLHAGEMTDRMYVLLSGSCSVVRHSRREGFQPQPPQQLQLGQALCEAALVVSARRSDVAVSVNAVAAVSAAAAGFPPPYALSAAAADKAAGDVGVASCGRHDRAGAGRGGGGDGGGEESNSGAALMVLTRGNWNGMCARAPSKPEYGEAKLALLCCCARSLASSDPALRTLEQSEDLAALLRLLPGLSPAPSPVLRALSEAVVLRQLPQSTIMFEEGTRAEAQFVVLAGGVEMHSRPKRQGGANRAALRSALRSAVAAARGRSARGGPKGGAEGQSKSLWQKIEEERRAREQIKQSLALQREGLRTPKVNASRVSTVKAVEEQFKMWMLEFLNRKRSGDTINSTTVASGVVDGGVPERARGPLTRAKSIKAANAWRRAAAKVLHTAAANGDDDGDARWPLERHDTTMVEYERRKMEEAGGLKDVGNLLGGAAARKAYMQGLAAKDGGMYADDDPEDDHSTNAAVRDRLKSSKSMAVRWKGESNAGDEKCEVEVEVDEEDEEDDPWVRLTYLDRRYQVARKPIKYIDAVEKVMGIAKRQSTENGKSSTGGGGGGSDSACGGGGGDPDADPEEQRADDGVDLLMLSGADDDAVSGRSTPGVAPDAAAATSGPGPDDVVDDACNEHLEQLFGACGAQVELGQVAGELPAALVDRSKRGGQQRTRRTHSAIAGPLGADVLVVALEALRRGHEVARDDLVSERLAVLTALEPLRGLSDEHQAQLALGCTVVNLDANQVVVRQSQFVDALFVVLEGEVKLLDDPDTTPAVAPPPQQPQQPSAAASNGGGSGGNASSTTAGGASNAASTAPEMPFRSATAAAGGGKLMSIKIRRAAASLAALTLLGPGGSFGESVLGYPQDATAAAAATSWEDNGAEASVPSSNYLATAMTSRPTKLLVMPRSLLIKYGYLRSSLPHFAHLRREAINGRRKQLKAGLQSRTTAAPAAATAYAVAPVASGSGTSSGTSVGGTHPGSVNSNIPQAKGSDRISSVLGVMQLPSPSSPMAPLPVGASAAATAAAQLVPSPGAFQAPRPPPMRPSEVLEHLGFKPVLRRLYNAGAKVGASAVSSLTNGAITAATAVTINGVGPGSASVAATANGSTVVIGGVSYGPGLAPPPLPHPTSNGFAATAAATAGVADQQHRRDLLAASVLAANNPHSLSNMIARARGEDPGSLPHIIHNAAAFGMPSQPHRATSDGSMMATAAMAAASPSGLAPPIPFSNSSSTVRMRPLRLSVSGAGTFTSDCNNSPSPVRRSSISGTTMNNGLAGSSGGCGIPALASPPPLRGSSGPFRVPANAISAPSPHIASVQLPRLSQAGNSSSGAVTPTASGGSSWRGPSRPSIPGEPFLARLEAVEPSAKSSSSQASGSHNPARSVSSGSIGSGGGSAAAPPPLVVTLLGQRSAGHPSMARA